VGDGDRGFVENRSRVAESTFGGDLLRPVTAR
jgi:hypothetical protein